jgi:ubiquinone/menaquinone biosynthesis C-methylase UbiE
MAKEEFQWTGERLTTAKDNEIVIHHLHRYALALDLVRDKVVLDIASGEGYGSNLLATVAQKVIGADISEDVIKFAQSKYVRPNLQFKVGSADKMPVPDHSIDILVSFETLEHHDKHEEMLQEIKRVLKPDGVLIMSSPDKMNYSDVPKFSNPFHVKELYREEFKALIEQYFSHVTIYYQSILYGSLIVPEDDRGQNFVEFTGDFNHIDKLPSIKTPVYNLCIASNKNIDALRSYDFSFFNAEKVLARILAKEMEIYNSKTYRAGKLVSAPLRFFRNIFGKG